MPAPAPIYVERLAVRARWWVVVIAIALGGSAELVAGFDWHVVAVVLPALLVPTLVLLALSARTTLVVDRDGLRAGGMTMSYDDMESVEALDGPRTRLLLGPQADPAARLVVRGYIRESVLVRPMRSEPTPYWLVSTRHPEQVIAAVEQAAQASRVH